MRRTLDLKEARVVHEQNLDRQKRPVSIGGQSAYVVKRVIDSKGRTVEETTTPLGRPPKKP